MHSPPGDSNETTSFVKDRCGAAPPLHFLFTQPPRMFPPALCQVQAGIVLLRLKIQNKECYYGVIDYSFRPVFRLFAPAAGEHRHFKDSRTQSINQTLY